jgi:RecB family exonuclease
MSNLIYKSIIDDMVWSYSRIKAYEDCPYRFFLKYIHEEEGQPMFYASYGSFVHKILQEFYEGELKQTEVTSRFLSGFSKEVQGERPKDSIVKSYIEKGAKYFSNFKPLPFEPIAIEQHAEFKVLGYNFRGYIDYIGERDGRLYIVDHKSRELKPRSKRKQPTKKDSELDEMLVQLYLYSIYVKQVFGSWPKSLCFNCFKNGEFIEEPFRKQDLERAVEWASQTIETIREDESFYPMEDFFSCKYICDLGHVCEMVN